MVADERRDDAEVEPPRDDVDFASEHARLTTSEAVSAGKDAHAGGDVPHGLGGMDLKRVHLLD